MSDTTSTALLMPPSPTNPEGSSLTLRDRILVVVGANGSGKTRFGAWLEEKHVRTCHRISAHRALNFPEQVTPRSLSEAELRLLTGFHDTKLLSDESQFKGFKNAQRWKNRPVTALLDDFEAVVTLLVSESFAVSDKYRQRMLHQAEHVPAPTTRIDLVKAIWESALPSRELLISGCSIDARNRADGVSYQAREMSDGERSIFHLIAEALSVPENGIFIVDEPELHLHRAVQSRLWDSVEQARPDCTFVYITHDLGFAASRKAATKVWIREFAHGTWDWEVVPETDALPESLLLEVMGSHRPILFVEGDRSSLDYLVYGRAFPAHTVVPCGSCEQVIHSVCSFAQMANLHHNECAGLVDNDGRSEADIGRLNGLGVLVLPVALIENLFLLEPVLAFAAERLGYDSKEAISKVKERVLTVLKSNAVRVVSNLTRMEIEAGLRAFGKSPDGVDELAAAYQEACAAINPKTIFEKWNQEIARVIAEQDYSAALRYYKTKGLHAEAGAVLGVRFLDQVLRWLQGNDSAALVSALRTGLPELSIAKNPTVAPAAE